MKVMLLDEILQEVLCHKGSIWIGTRIFSRSYLCESYTKRSLLRCNISFYMRKYYNRLLWTRLLYRVRRISTGRSNSYIYHYQVVLFYSHGPNLTVSACTQGRYSILVNLDANQAINTINTLRTQLGGLGPSFIQSTGALAQSATSFEHYNTAAQKTVGTSSAMSSSLSGSKFIRWAKFSNKYCCCDITKCYSSITANGRSIYTQR